MKNIFQPTDCLSQEEMNLYSKGKVSDELQFKVENHLLDCPLCNEAMEGFQNMDAEGEALLAEVFASVDAKTEETAISKPKRSFSVNRIAATVLFLIAAGAALFYYTQQQASNSYLAYFEGTENEFTVRAIEKDLLPSEIKVGVRLFEDKNFQGSLSFFQDYLEQVPESAEATYYAGMSAMRIGELGQAFEYFSTVRLNDDRLFEEATWAMVKIHLDRREKKEAKILLGELIKVEGGFFREQAERLLDEI